MNFYLGWMIYNASYTPVILFFTLRRYRQLKFEARKVAHNNALSILFSLSLSIALYLENGMYVISALFIGLMLCATNVLGNGNFTMMLQPVDLALKKTIDRLKFLILWIQRVTSTSLFVTSIIAAIFIGIGRIDMFNIAMAVLFFASEISKFINN